MINLISRQQNQMKKISMTLSRYLNSSVTKQKLHFGLPILALANDSKIFRRLEFQYLNHQAKMQFCSNNKSDINTNTNIDLQEMMENKKLLNILDQPQLYNLNSFIQIAQEVVQAQESIKIIKQLVSDMQAYENLQQHIIPHILKNLNIIQEELQQRQLIPYLVLIQIHIYEYEKKLNNQESRIKAIQYGDEVLFDLLNKTETLHNKNPEIQIFMIQLLYAYLGMYIDLQNLNKVDYFTDFIISQIERLDDESKKKTAKMEANLLCYSAKLLYQHKQYDKALQYAKRSNNIWKQQGDNEQDEVSFSNQAYNNIMSISLSGLSNIDEMLEYYAQNERNIDRLQQTYKSNKQHSMLISDCLNIQIELKLILKQMKVSDKGKYNELELVNIYLEAFKELEKHKEDFYVNQFYNRYVINQKQIKFKNELIEYSKLLGCFYISKLYDSKKFTKNNQTFR